MDDYSAFFATIDRYKTTPFSWGKHDCSLFVADAIEALRGVDYAKPFRGQYKTEKAAYKCLAKYGGIDGYLDGLFSRVHPSTARRGDILKVGNEIFSVGVCAGQTVWYMDQDGVKNIPARLGAIAWRVA